MPRRPRGERGTPPPPDTQPPVAEPEPQVDPVAAPEEHVEPPQTPERTPEENLEAAREEYIRAHEEYKSENPWRTGSVLNIGGDTSETTSARRNYDAALAAIARRDRGENFDSLSASAKASVNKGIFEKLIVDEEKKLAPVREANMEPREKKWREKAWSWYAKQPRWKKVALSIGVGTGIAAGSGAVAGMGLLYYAGRRALSPLISAGAGAVATAGLEGWDKTFGKKHTVEAKSDALVNRQEGDISESLDDLRIEYDGILSDAADREKKRAYLKMAVAAAAGAGTSIGLGMAFGEHVPTGAGSTDPHLHAPTESHVASHIVEVKKGDSLWRITGNELSKDEAFRNLNQAQQTYVISSLTNQEIAQHVAGAGSPDQLVPDTHLDLSGIFNDKDHLVQVMDHAKHLTPAQMENILANNRAIAEWAHAHPHEALTGSRVGDIIHDREHPAPLQAPAEAPHLGVGHGVDTPPEGLSYAQIEAMGGSKDMASMFPAESPHVVLAPEGFGHEMAGWQGDIKGGGQLFNNWDHLGAMTHQQAGHFLAEAAQKVGDHHPASVNIMDLEAVRHQMHEYLVAYPQVHQFGIKNYDEWARIKDIPAKQFMEEASPMSRLQEGEGAMHSALRHSFWHRGGQVHEVVNGKLHKVPLEEHHVVLGFTLRVLNDKGVNVPNDVTVGEFIASHPDATGNGLEAAHRMRSILDRVVSGKGTPPTAAKN